MIDDNKIKELISCSEKKASENLKYRIMQQIRTENVLKCHVKKEKNLNRQIKNVLTIIGVMYALIVFVVLGTVFYGGWEALIMPEFLMSIIFITTVTAVFSFIIYIDWKRRTPKKE